MAALSTVVVAHLAPPLVTLVLSGVVSAWLWRTRREVRGVNLYLLVILVGGIIWQLQLVALVLTSDWPTARFLVTSEKFTGFLASFIWVIFVAEYTDHDLHRRWWVQALFAFVIGGYVVLAVTNPTHHLLMTDIVRVEQPFFHGSAVRGPIYFVFLAITYAFVLAGMVMLAQFISRTRRSARLRITLLATGAVGVGIGNLSSVAGLGPIPTFQYGGYGAFPFILATTLGVFGMGLFDLAPVARTTLVETLTDAVVVVDDAHRVVDYNRRAVSLWPGLPGNEGKPISEACPELAGKVTFPATDAKSTQITLTMNGETAHYSLLVSPVQRTADEAGVLGHSLLLRDVTELERSRKRLESQNQRLDQVATTISHDLRNPLSVAQGYTSLLASTIDDPDALAYLDSIQESHERMTQIVGDVLSLARHDDGDVEVEPFCLEAAARDAWGNVATDGAALAVETSGTILADRGRLLTIFENLFRNALEHGGPDVTVSVDVFDGGFAVADDGPGVPEDAVDDVFEYGYTTHEQGTGLGLAIVETMAETHGWTVDLDSDSDGARFVFRGVTFEPQDEKDVPRRVPQE